MYDFTRSEGPNGWHTLSVSGEGENPTDKDLLRLANDVDLAPSDARGILDAVQSAVTDIPAKMKQIYGQDSASRLNSDSPGNGTLL